MATSKKKVVKKSQPKVETVTHTPADTPLDGPKADRPVSTTEDGKLTADPSLKLNRVLGKLLQAENESAEYAAIAEGLLEENTKLKEQIRRLTETVREFEQKAFSEEGKTEEAE